MIEYEELIHKNELPAADFNQIHRLEIIAYTP